VLLKNNGRVDCKTVVITAGTFLNGAIFVGKEKVNQLKNINPATNVLTLAIERVSGIKLGRLKTGTPPRLAKNSLDYSKLELQPTQELDYLFEFDPVEVKELAPCFVTHTTQETPKIIAQNISNAVWLQF
jgi:tRNA uridine 5-carboxymethylaminomethyl modification enzyme